MGDTLTGGYEVIEYPWGYFEISTESFCFKIFKKSGGNGRPITFRAVCSAKVNGREYVLAWRHFHEWDYRGKSDAFESAKEWIRQAIEATLANLHEILLEFGKEVDPNEDP